MGTGQVPVWNVPFRRNPFFTGREPIFTQIHRLLHQWPGWHWQDADGGGVCLSLS